MTSPDRWADRAAAAERAVIERHARRLWAVPGTVLGVNSYPSSLAHRLFLGWNYWWQAHLLDCLVDAELRDPRPDRVQRIRSLVRGIRLANGGRWTNAYYDDMAWLALALQRAERAGATDRTPAVRRLTATILAGWSQELGGGVPWRRGDAFKNAPANGPAAILLARTGHLDRAAATADWIDGRLRDPATGLIRDGVRPAGDGGARVETVIYGYCQGVVLGAELELAQRLPAARPQSWARIHRLTAAVNTRLATDGVLTGHRGGDSGLFTGILARYLALVATGLPGCTADDERTRATARALVLRSAAAAWTNAAAVDGLPGFGPDWGQPVIRPSADPGNESRDLSVQLSGWMLMEAAHAVIAAPGHRRTVG